MQPAGGTQVKWNRQDGNVLASSHMNEVLIWDRRVSRFSYSCVHVAVCSIERVYSREEYQGAFGENLWY
jgi:hypothetical protein